MAKQVEYLFFYFKRIMSFLFLYFRQKEKEKLAIKDFKYFCFLFPLTGYTVFLWELLAPLLKIFTVA